MKIAYIHDHRKLNTGAHHINDLMVHKLREEGILVKNVYPKGSLLDTKHINLKGVANILFFYSLLEQKKEILKYDLIQGTTYTPITFLPFGVPVISHFGSTTKGFLLSVPKFKNIETELVSVWQSLKKARVISDYDLKTRKPMRDIADIEFFVASKASKIIATSKLVKTELVQYGNVPPQNIRVIHNAIEDYWFETTLADLGKPKLVFLGRLGNDVFTWKLKGLDRMIKLYQEFPDIEKSSIIMTTHDKLPEWLQNNIINHQLLVNYPKDQIKDVLQPLRGSVVLLTSRYEGFSLSLIEAMSQGIIPIAYPVGVAPEIIVDGENGFIVHTIDEAHARIEQILSDNKLRLSMSLAAYITSLQFRSSIMAKKLVSLYESVVESKHAYHSRTLPDIQDKSVFIR